MGIVEHGFGAVQASHRVSPLYQFLHELSGAAAEVEEAGVGGKSGQQQGFQRANLVGRILGSHSLVVEPSPGVVLGVAIVSDHDGLGRS